MYAERLRIADEGQRLGPRQHEVEGRQELLELDREVGAELLVAQQVDARLDVFDVGRRRGCEEPHHALVAVAQLRDLVLEALAARPRRPRRCRRPAPPSGGAPRRSSPPRCPAVLSVAGAVDAGDRLQQLGLADAAGRGTSPPRSGASKPVSSIDLTIRKASGSRFAGSSWSSGFLNCSMRPPTWPRRSTRRQLGVSLCAAGDHRRELQLRGSAPGSAQARTRICCSGAGTATSSSSSAERSGQASRARRPARRAPVERLADSGPPPGGCRPPPAP